MTNKSNVNQNSFLRIERYQRRKKDLSIKNFFINAFKKKDYKSWINSNIASIIMALVMTSKSVLIHFQKSTIPMIFTSITLYIFIIYLFEIIWLKVNADSIEKKSRIIILISSGLMILAWLLIMAIRA